MEEFKNLVYVISFAISSIGWLVILWFYIHDKDEDNVNYQDKAKFK